MTKSKIPSLGLIWGGPTFGTVLHHTSGTRTITVPGNAFGNNYLNVVLDSRTSPDADHNFPSWGTVTIKSIITDSECTAIASQAANLATTVVPGTYSYGGKGYTCGSTRFVDPQEILGGYNQFHALTCTNVGPPFACEIAPGVDCSGLIFWSYNKTVGATTKSNGFLQAESSGGQCSAGASDPISESELRPGDIACLPGHVAMYVGPDHFRDAIEAANCSAGIVWTTKNNLKGRAGFQGFRRLKCSSQYAFTVKSHSPISLVVTDPDGHTISVDTTEFTNEEVLHEIPGVLYYVQDDEDGDVVFGPTLKSGVYRIRAVPKPGAASNATFGLEVIGAGYLLTLAQNVPISSIPPEGYSIRSTGDEIIPVNPNLTPTTGVLSSDVNPAELGQLITFTVTVSSSNGTPSGNVAIKNAGNILSTVALNSSGTATFAINSLDAGVHSIVAEYLGDGITFSGSVSNTILQQVKPIPAVQISNLIISVSGSSTLPEGIKTSLNAKLNAALEALQNENLTTSCTKLQDFINEVDAQKAKKIPVMLADSFSSSAEQIMSDLSCGALASAASKVESRSNTSKGTVVHYVVYTLVRALWYRI